MSNYHYNKLQDEINKKLKLQQRIQELGYQPEEHSKPNDEQMRTQITYNQALALLAIKMQWNSQQIQLIKNNFQVFWAEQWYQFSSHTQPGS